jgi:hypothetical protein
MRLRLHQRSNSGHELVNGGVLGCDDRRLGRQFCAEVRDDSVLLAATAASALSVVQLLAWPLHARPRRV